MKRITLTVTVLTLAQMPLLAQSPVITNQPVSRTVWSGGNVNFSVAVTGVGPFTYQWVLSGVPMSDDSMATVAGGGTNYPGDGGAATNASLNAPVGLVFDASGNLFIADSGNGLVRRVDSDGVITTVAGGGTNFPGDGGAATNTSLRSPGGLAMDASGNLFVAEGNGLVNGLVRKVDTNGVITTVAGGGTNYPGDGGAATNASIAPLGIALDAVGNLFMADPQNKVVRKVDTNGIITTIIVSGFYGDPVQGYPCFVATDTADNLYVAYSVTAYSVGHNYGGAAVFKVSTDGSTTTLITDGWTIRPPEPVGWPDNYYDYDAIGINGMALDPTGNLFIAQSSHVTANIWSSAGPFGSQQLHYDEDIASIYEVQANGSGETRAGFWGFDEVTGVAVDSAGNILVSDYYGSAVFRILNTEGPTLSLQNVTTNDAGDYQVIVTDADSNTVTSSVVSLTVATTPQIYSAAHNPDGSMALSCVSPPSSTNFMQVATNLAPPVLWQTISTNIAGVDDGDWQFTDTNTGNCPARFYRSATVAGQ